MLAVSDVRATVNLSVLSSKPIKALSPVETLSISIPQSLALELAPLLSYIKGSLTVVFVVLTVVVVPFTVKLPVTVTSLLNVLSPATV